MDFNLKEHKFFILSVLSFFSFVNQNSWRITDKSPKSDCQISVVLYFSFVNDFFKNCKEINEYQLSVDDFAVF